MRNVRKTLRALFINALKDAAKESADSFYAKFGKLATGHGKKVRIKNSLLDGWSIVVHRSRVWRVQQYPSTNAYLYDKEGKTHWQGSSISSVPSMAADLFEALYPIKGEPELQVWMKVAEMVSDKRGTDARIIGSI